MDKILKAISDQKESLEIRERNQCIELNNNTDRGPCKKRILVDLSVSLLVAIAYTDIAVLVMPCKSYGRTTKTTYIVPHCYTVFGTYVAQITRKN